MKKIILMCLFLSSTILYGEAKAVAMDKKVPDHQEIPLNIYMSDFLSQAGRSVGVFKLQSPGRLVLADLTELKTKKLKVVVSVKDIQIDGVLKKSLHLEVVDKKDRATAMASTWIDNAPFSLSLQLFQNESKSPAPILTISSKK